MVKVIDGDGITGQEVQHTSLPITLHPPPITPRATRGHGHTIDLPRMISICKSNKPTHSQASGYNVCAIERLPTPKVLVGISYALRHSFSQVSSCPLLQGWHASSNEDENNDISLSRQMCRLADIRLDSKSSCNHAALFALAARAQTRQKPQPTESPNFFQDNATFLSRQAGWSHICTHGGHQPNHPAHVRFT